MTELFWVVFTLLLISLVIHWYQHWYNKQLQDVIQHFLKEKSWKNDTSRNSEDKTTGD